MNFRIPFYLKSVVFFLYGIFFLSPLWAEFSSVEEERGKARNAFACLEENQQYRDQLYMADLNHLPIGLSKTIDHIEYTIAVNECKTFSDHAELSVYGRISIPQTIDGKESLKELFFGAQGIAMSLEGEFLGDVQLMLLGDVSIPVNGNKAALVLKGGFNPLSGQAMDFTYMTFDCRGFKEVVVSAEVVFSEDHIYRTNPAGDFLGKVSAAFQTRLTNWNDILVQISLPCFAVKGLDGYQFDVQQAVFDFSDLQNAPGCVFPAAYPYLIRENPALWRGVYIQNVRVSLPKAFQERDSTRRVAFDAYHMIIDNNGVSGLFSAENVLSIEKGNAGGWRFSVNRFSIQLEANHLVGGGFSGYIGLPLSQLDTLAYEAFIAQDNEYQLRISSLKPMHFDLWAARAELDANSFISLKILHNRFYPEALLNGSLSIAAGTDARSKEIDASLDGILFQRLHLTGESPYITLGALGYKGEIRFMNFPASLEDLSFETRGNESILNFSVKLALGFAKFPLQAKTRLGVAGEMKVKEGIRTWEFSKLHISDIGLNATLAEVFSLNGNLSILKNDPVYGNGLAGTLRMELHKVLEGLQVEVRAIFGKADFPYWMVDGKVGFNKGIPVFPPVQLCGFGGGAYYRMSAGGADASNPTGLGYKPDKDVLLGVKAAVMFYAGSEKALKGEASFEAAFNQNGGIHYIGLFGRAQMLTSVPGGLDNIEKAVSDKFKAVADQEKSLLQGSQTLQTLEKLKLYEPDKAAAMVFPKPKDGKNANFMADLGVQYDFKRNALHANLNVYVDVLGGMLRGSGLNKRAGGAVLHHRTGRMVFAYGNSGKPPGAFV